MTPGSAGQKNQPGRAGCRAVPSMPLESPVPMPRRFRLAALSLVLVVLAAACQVRTAVTVDMADDGSGTVEVAVGLDADALSRLPDIDHDGTPGAADLAALVRDDDLVAAGWTVAEPEADDDGTTWLRVTRAFGTPEEANQILEEVAGSDGPFDFDVSHVETFGESRYVFWAFADLSEGLEGFGDEGLAAALEGEPLGEDAALIAARTGQPIDEIFTLEITALLPGDETTWSLRLGDPPETMRAESVQYDWPVLTLAALALVSLLVLVVVLVRRVLRSRA